MVWILEARSEGQEKERRRAWMRVVGSSFSLVYLDNVELC